MNIRPVSVIRSGRAVFEIVQYSHQHSTASDGLSIHVYIVILALRINRSVTFCHVENRLVPDEISRDTHLRAAITFRPNYTFSSQSIARVCKTKLIHLILIPARIYSQRFKRATSDRP